MKSISRSFGALARNRTSARLPITGARLVNSRPMHTGQEAEPFALGDEDFEHLLSDLRSQVLPTPSTSPSPLPITPPRHPMAVFDSLQKRLAHSTEPDLSEASTSPVLVAEKSSGYLDMLHQLEEKVEAAEATMPSTSSKQASANVTMDVATQTEWESLFQAALDADDKSGAKKVIDLMKRCGTADQENSLTDRLLFSYVFANDVQGVTDYIGHLRSTGTELSLPQIHMHVQVHINIRSYSEAQALIHAYESENLLPLEATYRSFIDSLIATPSTSPAAPRHRALAWDMFAHMRYAAHPDPSLETYTTMLRACASATSPSAERALDLFHEMTVDNRMDVTTAAYNAVMLTCARSPNKVYAQETYRLGKKLLDEYWASKAEVLRPDLDTFKAMLEAAMRNGDLGRARWIVAELVRAKEKVDDELMAHAFHAYAAYRPPTLRLKTVNVVNTVPTQEFQLPTDPSPEPEASPPQPAQVSGPSVVVPQTSAEVLREVDALFARIQNASQLAETGMDDDQTHPDWVFTSVRITTNLLNAYLAAQCNHGSPQEVAKGFAALFKQFGVSRNGQSFATVLERLATVKGGREVKVGALKAAGPVWEDWLAFSGEVELDSLREAENRLSARRVESVWATMIRIMTLGGDTTGAIQLTKDFSSRYPPNAILPPVNNPEAMKMAIVNSKLPKESFPTRVSLLAPQPLVRMTTNTDIPDNAIPPFLSFTDLEVLHHRLVVKSQSGSDAQKKEAVKGIAFLRWVCFAYRGRLKRRKQLTMKG